MNIALHGSYFGRNFGDTLILSIVYNWIKEIDPNGKVILPYINNKLEYDEITQGNENISQNIINYKNIDGFIFGPGGYFGEPPKDFLRVQKWSYRNYLRHIAWNKELFENKIPYMILGVGVGPISNIFLRKKIIRLFQSARFISVRDTISKDYLVKWGIEEKRINVIKDVALTLNPLNNSLKHNNKIGIHLTGNSIYKNRKIKVLSNFLSSLSNDFEFEFIEDHVNQFSNNLNVKNNKSELVENGINGRVVKYVDPNQLIEDINKIKLLITSKLHMGIVAFAQGVPVISIPIHSKTLRFYKQVNRLECCIDSSKLTEKQLKEAFEFCNNNPIDNIQVHQEALRNFGLLKDFFNSIYQYKSYKCSIN